MWWITPRYCNVLRRLHTPSSSGSSTNCLRRACPATKCMSERKIEGRCLHRSSCRGRRPYQKRYCEGAPACRRSSSELLPVVECKADVARRMAFAAMQIILDKKGGKLYWCDREGICATTST